MRCLLPGWRRRAYLSADWHGQGGTTVPVTARLSTRFYQTFSDEIANELVDWFNAVDAQFRQQLQETNELNWERFRAELRAESAAIRAQLPAEFRTGLAGLEMTLRAEIAAVRSELREEIGTVRAELLKWMFIYWTGTVVTVGGMMVGLAALLR